MAKDISLLGANYTGVPAVELPQTGGGTAMFYDIQVINSLDSDSTTDALSAAQGKVLNDTKISASTISIKTGDNNWWEAPADGLPHYYHYEGQNTTTYKIPSSLCEVMVIKKTNSRGVAWAIKWANSSPKQMWFAQLHDDTQQSNFGAWEQLALNSDLQPFQTAKSWSDGVKPTLTNGSHYGVGTYYFKVGCFVYLVVSAEFSSAPTNVNLFTLPAGYRPIGVAEITVGGGATYNAKAQCQIRTNGNVTVTSADKYVIGSGFFLIGG